MTIESSPLQPNLGLDFDTSRVVLPVIDLPLNHELSGRALAELIAAQHLADREMPYFGPGSPGVSTDRAWEAIARRNPKYMDRVFRIQDAMRDARYETAQDLERKKFRGVTFHDTIIDEWYDEVEHSGTRAVLQDLIRLSQKWGLDTWAYSLKIGNAVTDKMPWAKDQDGWVTYDGVTPGDLFSLMLDSEIKLPAWDNREIMEWHL